MKIGIVGLAGAGKDTVANFLLPHLAGFEITRYASLLKEAARQVFGENFDDRDVKEEKVFITPDLADKIIDATDYVQLKLGLNPEDFEIWNDLCTKHVDSKSWLSPRDFQVLLGTEVGRKLNPKIWVDYLQDHEGSFIVPDVRFGNEQLDITILVINPDVTASVKGEIHSSELLAYELSTALNPYYDVDYVIYNNGSMGKLQNEVERIANLIKKDILKR